MVIWFQVAQALAYPHSSTQWPTHGISKSKSSRGKQGLRQAIPESSRRKQVIRQAIAQSTTSPPIPVPTNRIPREAAQGLLAGGTRRRARKAR